MNDREATIALNMLPKVGPVKVRRLLDYFGTPEAVLKANENSLSKIQGIGVQTAKSIAHWQDSVDLISELDEIKSRGLTILTLADDDYPKSLRQMYDSPLVLYVWGELKSRDQHAFSMVGSRKTTHYGREVARKFALQLASAGYTIVSGMARGIDTYSHQGAIAAGGRTIAVIGSGLGQIYPPENMALAEQIAASHGAVVSEFPLNTTPSKKTFPMRNRIVASWSKALIVVECPKWSGSMITANLAAEAGTPVYAVPGPVDRPSSDGCNHLIREGAVLLSKAEDIIEDFSELPLLVEANAGESARVEFKGPEMTHKMPSLDPRGDLIYSYLNKEELSLDQLIGLTDLTVAELLPELLKLEMKKLIKQLPGPRYVAMTK